jgi:hypothetical protein
MSALSSCSSSSSRLPSTPEVVPFACRVSEGVTVGPFIDAAKIQYKCSSADARSSETMAYAMDDDLVFQRYHVMSCVYPNDGTTVWRVCLSEQRGPCTPFLVVGEVYFRVRPGASSDDINQRMTRICERNRYDHTETQRMYDIGKAFTSTQCGGIPFVDLHTGNMI